LSQRIGVKTSTILNRSRFPDTDGSRPPYSARIYPRVSSPQPSMPDHPRSFEPPEGTPNSGSDDSRSRDFAGLYRATLSPLRRYLARLLGNTTEAQDIAHDAYVRVYPSIENKTAEKPEALLYVTARRLAINRLKRRSISPEGTAGSSDPAHQTTASACPSVPQQVMAQQELSLLETAIAELPAGCRAVLLLRKVELLSHREIADRLGIAVSTVEKQHARALRLLRAALPAEAFHHHNPDASAATQEARS
jgi:RNA polymerase sigma factor (sigma-70 family)